MKEIGELVASLLCLDKGPVIIYHLGEGGGGAEDFGRDHLLFRRTEGASVVTESPKGGDH